MTSNILIRINDCISSKDSVLAYGHFNTIHPGHIRYLKYAKKQGKNLFIALMGDKSLNDSFTFKFNQKDRSNALSLIGIADKIILLDANELSLAVEKITPKLLILGKEFESSSEEEIVKSINIQRKADRRFSFYGGEITYSNSELLNGIGSEIEAKRKKEFSAACLKNNIYLETLYESISHWKNTNLVVIGDSILDQYVACEALGMSAEAPVIVVKELESKNFIGGAGIVAGHISSLGANCTLISVIGDDQNGESLRNKLIEAGIKDGLEIDSERPTTFKKRYVVDNQKLFRVSKLEQFQINSKIEEKIINRLEQIAPDIDGIVISDFVYGVVTENVLKAINLIAEKYSLMLFGDLQCSTQVGSITKFNNFTLVCPNEREARIAMQDKDSGLEYLSNKLLSLTKSEKLIMKLGPQGFIAYEKDTNGQYFSQSFPALSVTPIDLTGAGDSLLAVMATGLSSKQPMMQTAAIGSCMAAIAVETLGNTPIDLDKLREKIYSTFKK